MQTDCGAGLSGDRPELRHRRTATPRNGEGDARVGEQRVTGRPIGLGNQLDASFGQTGGDESGTQGVLHDRDRRAECVASYAHDGGVPSAQHSGGVCENVRSTLEHEAHHSEGS